MVKEKIKASAKKLKQETRKSVVTALIAAFGFLIALVWRDVITEAVDNLVEFSPIQGTLISAIVITFICVIGILIISRYSAEQK